MPTQRIYGTCPHDCPDTCGFITEVEDGRALDFYADPEHPITQGWLCAKVRDYLDHVYHPDRLLYPVRRTGPKGSGQWTRISWKNALAEIGERWRALIEQYGAEAILPYSYSGTLGVVQMLVTNGRFWNRLGASQLERSICGAAAEYAVKMTLGVRHSPPYADVAHSRLVIIWGHNPASTAPHFMPHLKKAQRNGTRVIVIDPRRTRTARGADLHVAPLPNSDGALALGLAHVIEAEGLHDEGWLEAHTVGWPELRARLADYPPARVAHITGLAEGDIVALARAYAASQPALIKIADGLQRHQNGGQTVRAICALPALIGQYGRRGGGLAYSTSGYYKWDGNAAQKWDECPPTGRVVNMNRLGAALLGEVTGPPIKSLYVYGSNPAAIAPNAGQVVAGLQREDLFTVVHELFMTDTADYADIVLPATSQLEQTDLHKAYGHTLLSYNRPAIAPLGQAKSNWQVMRLLAETMGFDEPWLHQTEDEIIAELLEAMAAKDPAFANISLARLQEEHTIPLELETTTPFADLTFPTPSGKVELYSRSMARAGLDPLPGWAGISPPGPPKGREKQQIPSAGQEQGRPGKQTVGADNDSTPSQPPPVSRGRSQSLPLSGGADSSPLVLISGAAHHFVTSSLANQPSLQRREGTPFVEIHPQDAARRSISDGQTVIIENERGWCKLQAVVTDAVRPGVLASPKGRWAKHDPFQNGHGGRNVNWTTPDALGDMAGQSTFHSNQVWIRPCKPASASTPS